MDLSKRPDGPIHFLGMPMRNIHTNDRGSRGNQCFGAGKAILTHTDGNTDLVGMLRRFKHGDIRLDGTESDAGSPFPQGKPLHWPFPPQ